jgi:hypothetical protein
MPISFVVIIITLKPNNLAVSLKGNDMRRDSIKKPSIVTSNQNASWECQESFF